MHLATGPVAWRLTVERLSEIDEHADRSWLKGFDGRIKLLCSISLVVVSALLRGLEPLLVVLAFVLGLVLLSRVPLRHIAKNFALTLPFVGFAALTVLFTNGIDAAAILSVRIGSSVLVLLILVSTTPFFQMMGAFRALHIPKVMANLILFTYRFIFLFLDEMERMRTARIARGFTGGWSFLDRRALKTLGTSIGMTFMRANGRATIIYDALLSRGYTGDIRSFERSRVRPRDALLVSAFALVGIMAILLETEVIPWTL
jgi:cobalt/nickel transport system permease protein